MTMLYIKGRLAFQSLLDRAKKAVSDPKGATVSEYALVLALVTVAVIAVLTNLGETIKSRINTIITDLGGTPSP